MLSCPPVSAARPAPAARAVDSTRGAVESSSRGVGLDIQRKNGSSAGGASGVQGSGARKRSKPNSGGRDGSDAEDEDIVGVSELYASLPNRLADMQETGVGPDGVRAKLVMSIRMGHDVPKDGYRWRKYGQKFVKGSPFPRSYYKCTHEGCTVRKNFQRNGKDSGCVLVTYEGVHTHDIPGSGTARKKKQKAEPYNRLSVWNNASAEQRVRLCPFPSHVLSCVIGFILKGLRYLHMQAAALEAAEKEGAAAVAVIASPEIEKAARSEGSRSIPMIDLSKHDNLHAKSNGPLPRTSGYAPSGSKPMDGRDMPRYAGSSVAERGTQPTRVHFDARSSEVTRAVATNIEGLAAVNLRGTIQRPLDPRPRISGPAARLTPANISPSRAHMNTPSTADRPLPHSDDLQIKPWMLSSELGSLLASCPIVAAMDAQEVGFTTGAGLGRSGTETRWRVGQGADNAGKGGCRSGADLPEMLVAQNERIIPEEKECLRVPEPRDSLMVRLNDMQQKGVGPDGRTARLVTWNQTALDVIEDGYRWRLYGQKTIGDNLFRRRYFKCRIPSCPARKRVERSRKDSACLVVTYDGIHSHDLPNPGSPLTEERNSAIEKERSPARLVEDTLQEILPKSLAVATSTANIPRPMESRSPEGTPYVPSIPRSTSATPSPAGTPSKPDHSPTLATRRVRRERRSSSSALRVPSEVVDAIGKANGVGTSRESDRAGRILRRNLNAAAGGSAGVTVSDVAPQKRKRTKKRFRLRKYIENRIVVPEPYEAVPGRLADMQETGVGPDGKTAKLVMWIRKESDKVEDGYRWRKYGQQFVGKSVFLRQYFKCNHPCCAVRKYVERSKQDSSCVVVIYEGVHCHGVPEARRSLAVGNDASEREVEDASLAGDSKDPEATTARARLAAPSVPSSRSQSPSEDHSNPVSTVASPSLAASPSGRLPSSRVAKRLQKQMFGNPLQSVMPVEYSTEANGTVERLVALADGAGEGARGSANEIARNSVDHDAAGNETHLFAGNGKSAMEEDDIEGTPGYIELAEKLAAMQKRGVRPDGRTAKLVITIQTDTENVRDGYRWRKYGQKMISGNPFPRCYYRCTHHGCVVRKQVERSSEDNACMVVTYDGVHTHKMPIFESWAVSKRNAALRREAALRKSARAARQVRCHLLVMLFLCCCYSMSLFISPSLAGR
jgi:hypothetical protein